MNVKRGRAPLGVGASLGLACLLAVGAGAARADTFVTATYTGTVTQLIDKDGLVGAPVTLATVVNLPFTATYEFDVDNGLRITGPVGSPSGLLPADNLLGGSLFGGSAPLISAQLTINGSTINFGGNYVSQQFTQLGRIVNSGADSFINSGLLSTSFFSLGTSAAPALLTTPFSSGATDPSISIASAFICVYGGGNCVEDRFSIIGTTDHVTVSAGVPEPSTWAMMILGAGAAGAAMRRRRGAAARA